MAMSSRGIDICNRCGEEVAEQSFVHPGNRIWCERCEKAARDKRNLRRRMKRGTGLVKVPKFKSPWAQTPDRKTR
jgi:hypothetical protein